MDRSFLSDPAIVTASRDFICARLLTYESKEEADFLKECFTGGSGELENTTFTFLAPDGQTRVTGAGRAPNHVFRGATEDAEKAMAAKMKDLAAKYAGDPKIARQLPVMADARRGLATAASDLSTLTVVVAKNEEQRKAIGGKLAKLAWDGKFIGRTVYAAATSDDLKMVTGVELRNDGIVVIEPDEFGMKGKVLAQCAADGDLEKTLAAGLKAYTPKAKDSREHMDEGRSEGIHWETAIPVTDPGPRGGPPPGGR